MNKAQCGAGIGDLLGMLGPFGPAMRVSDAQSAIPGPESLQRAEAYRNALAAFQGQQPDYGALQSLNPSWHHQQVTQARESRLDVGAALWHAMERKAVRDAERDLAEAEFDSWIPNPEYWR